MKEKDLIYTTKFPVGFTTRNMNAEELNKITLENGRTVDRIETEAIKRDSILYRFVYELTEAGVAIYQIISVNRITCTVRHCLVDASQDNMVALWGNEAHVGTNYIKKRLKAWSMVMGFESNALALENQPRPASEVAYQLGNQYLYIQTCDEGYNYVLYSESFLLVSEGIYNGRQPNIFEVAKLLLGYFKSLETEPVQILPEMLAEMAGDVNAILKGGIDPAVLVRLIMGNVGDETALKNICEAQSECIEDLTNDDKEFLIETNSFYRSGAEFSLLHDTEYSDFERLVEDGIIVKTTDGYVYKNCV